jgi:heat shock protein HspQ
MVLSIAAPKGLNTERRPGMKRAKFNVGQVVRHLKFEYRGVVVDVDPVYQGDDAWYEKVATSRPPKDAPWYRVLVDDAETMTYVAERHLAQPADASPIRHPMLKEFLVDAIDDGLYKARHTVN